MDSTRYYVALVTVVAFPPPVIAWLLIHPLADKLRRIGLTGAYALIFSFYAIGMFAIWSARGYILTIEFGFSVPLMVLAIVLWGVSIYIRVLWRRVQRRSTIFGLPELRREREPDDLVTEGIYARVRNPRYLEVGLVLWAIALFSNYLAVYIFCIAYIILIYAVVLLEERELKNRFGAAYEEYCSRVPRFIPRRRLSGSD
jgi:protein-S-isoprenylcysteine O-methyltransferase Ste14